MPRVGSSRQSTRRRRVAVGDDREREPLALAAGEVARMAVGERGEAGALERRRVELVADALVDEVVAGVLQQQRDATGALDPPARRLHQRRPRGAAASTCRRRFARAARRARPARQRERHVGAGSRARRPARARRRRSASAGAVVARAPRPAPAPRAAAARGGGSGVGQQAGGAQRRARLLDAGRRRREAEPGDQRGARRLERRLRLVRPREEAARRGVAGERAALEGDHAVGRAEAALEPVLGEHDRRPPLLVEPPQQREQLIARDRVQLRGRLVEHEQPRTAGERRAERDALQLAAREVDRRAVEQRLDAERERDLLDAARDGDGAVAAVLERERQLGAHACPSRPASPGPGRASRRRPRAPPDRGSRRSMPQISARPSKRPPWKCGTSPLARRSSVDLPAAEPPASDDELPLGELERQRRAAPAPALRGRCR